MSTRRPPTNSAGSGRGGRPADRYGDDGTARPAFVPGILAAVAALIGLGFDPHSGGATVVRYVVAILALIIIVFAVQAKLYVWVGPLIAIAVLWNPVVPFRFDGVWWSVVEVLAAAVLVGAGATIKILDPTP